MKQYAGGPDRERGEALAELLVTIAIIGITVVAIVGALADSILASSTQRQYASADTIARSVGETLKDRTIAWVPDGSYPPSTWSTVDTTGYNVALTAQCWNGDSPATFKACPNGNKGLQKITVTVSSAGGSRGQVMTILKRRT
jgi:type II secretory pathway pseudopilin PulG